jgi:hypothetical protein
MGDKLTMGLGGRCRKPLRRQLMRFGTREWWYFERLEGKEQPLERAESGSILGDVEAPSSRHGFASKKPSGSAASTLQIGR